MCKLQWPDNTFEQENKNVWLKRRSYLCFVLYYFLHAGTLHMLFRVNRFEFALNILKQIYMVSTFGMLHLN